MGKVLHYGIHILSKNPEYSTSPLASEDVDFLSINEPCFHPYSLCWGFETTDGKEVRISRDSIDGISWEPVTE